MKKILNILFNFIFPLRKESIYFLEWSPEDYTEKLLSGSYDEHYSYLFSYKDKKVRMLIRSLKKERAPHIGESISTLLSEEILSLFSEDAYTLGNAIYIVPIPISKKRMKERGFNQCNWIAQLTTEKLGSGFVYSPHVLSKIRETKKQSVLKRGERLKNPARSFKASNVPHNAHIILLDDVITTGATVREAKRILKKAGAQKIDIVSIAR